MIQKWHCGGGKMRHYCFSVCLEHPKRQQIWVPLARPDVRSLLIEPSDLGICRSWQLQSETTASVSLFVEWSTERIDRSGMRP
jgi:hypothetical protein